MEARMFSMTITFPWGVQRFFMKFLSYLRPKYAIFDHVVALFKVFKINTSA